MMMMVIIVFLNTKMTVFAYTVYRQVETVKVTLLNATATFVKTVDNVACGVTTLGTIVSAQRSGQEIDVKQNWKTALWSVFIRYLCVTFAAIY